MEYFVVFFLGIAASMMILRWIVGRAIDRIMGQTDLEDRPATTQRVELRVELDKNTYFCYNIADGTFVCQGTDLNEIQTHFRSRFPGHDGVIVEGDEASTVWLKTEMRKSNENSNSVGHTS